MKNQKNETKSIKTNVNNNYSEYQNLPDLEDLSQNQKDEGKKKITSKISKDDKTMMLIHNNSTLNNNQGQENNKEDKSNFNQIQNNNLNKQMELKRLSLNNSNITDGSIDQLENNNQYQMLKKTKEIEEKIDTTNKEVKVENIQNEENSFEKNKKKENRHSKLFLNQFKKFFSKILMEDIERINEHEDMEENKNNKQIGNFRIKTKNRFMKIISIDSMTNQYNTESILNLIINLIEYIKKEIYSLYMEKGIINKELLKYINDLEEKFLLISKEVLNNNISKKKLQEENINKLNNEIKSKQSSRALYKSSEYEKIISKKEILRKYEILVNSNQKLNNLNQLEREFCEFEIKKRQLKRELILKEALLKKEIVNFQKSVGELQILKQSLIEEEFELKEYKKRILNMKQLKNEKLKRLYTNYENSHNIINTKYDMLSKRSEVNLKTQNYNGKSVNLRTLVEFGIQDIDDISYSQEKENKLTIKSKITMPPNIKLYKRIGHSKERKE